MIVGTKGNNVKTCARKDGAPAASQPATRRIPALLVVLSGTFALLYLVAGLTTPLIFVDFFGFIEHADRLPREWLDGFYPTGYPLLLRALFSLFADYKVAGVIVSAVSAGAALLAAHSLGARLGGAPAAGLAALLLLAVNPPFVHWGMLGATEMPALALTLWSAVWLLRNDGRGSALLAGACMGA